MDNYLQGQTVPWMSEKAQNIIQAGIPLFELRYPRNIDNPKTISGPFGVEANPQLDMAGNTRMSVKWKTGKEAVLRYEVDNKGNGLAWMPDDPWWHNRIILLDNMALNPVNLHTPRDGIISMREVRVELEALQEILKEMVPIFKVMKDGREVSFFYDKKRAEREVEKHTSPVTVADPKTGVLKIVSRSDNEWTIEEGSKLVYKKTVQDLVLRYRNIQYGWTACTEFMADIKPKAMTAAQKKKTTNVQIPGSFDIVSAVGTMSEAEREHLRNLLFSTKGQEMGVKTEAPPKPLITPDEKAQYEVKPSPIPGMAGKVYKDGEEISKDEHDELLNKLYEEIYFGPYEPDKDIFRNRPLKKFSDSLMVKLKLEQLAQLVKRFAGPDKMPYGVQRKQMIRHIQHLRDGETKPFEYILGKGMYWRPKVDEPNPEGRKIVTEAVVPAGV